VVVGAAAASERQYVMRRRFFKLATVVSLLLCAATVVMWVRSLGTADHVQWNRAWVPEPGVLEHRILSFSSADGVGYFGWTTRRDDDSNFQYGWNNVEYSKRSPRAEDARWPVDPFWKRRFGFDHVSMYAGSHSYIIAAPHAMWATVAAMPTLTLAVRWVRKRRRAGRGLCPSCGYDLRATPDRCPECGCVLAGGLRTAA
jgi:hypothetical protein